jgi:hypothetical protein
MLKRRAAGAHLHSVAGAGILRALSVLAHITPSDLSVVAALASIAFVLGLRAAAAYLRRTRR